MQDFYIFDIPIYLRPESRYYTDLETATTRFLRKMFPSVESPRERFPRQCESIATDFHKTFGGPWDFNQVVGWLRLYVERSAVGGHLWWVDAKRLQTRMRKTFYLVSPSNVLATWIKPEDQSGKIFAETLAQIESLSRQRSYNGRFFDLTAFRNLGPFVDWRGLLDGAARKFVSAVPDAGLTVGESDPNR